MKNFFIAAAALLLLVYVFDIDWEVKRPPGIVVSDEPRQWDVSGPTWTIGRDRMTALASFSARVLVLRTARYFLGIESRFSPVDFAVGWGPMSDRTLLDQLSFSQGHRFLNYYPKGRGFPIPFDEINSHSANMHMIPSSHEIHRLLLAVHRGDIVDFDGYLVEVDPKEGGSWRSSLSRTDTGAGACEIVRVEHLSIE
jgi:hypothetical protein